MAKGAKAGTILFDLRAGVAKLDSDFAKASKKVSGKLDGIEKLFKRAATAFGAYLGTKKLVSFVQSTLQAGQALHDLTMRTGIASDSLQELRYAGENAGVSMDMIDASLQRFNRRLGSAINGNTAMVDAFKAAGVEIRDASGHVKNADTVLMEFADSMAKLPTEAQRAAHASNLFGISGRQMIPMFKDGAEGLRRMREEAHRFGAVMSADTIVATVRFNTILYKLRMDTRGMINAFTEGLLPALEGIGQAMLDAGGGAEKYAKITEWVGEAVSLAASWLDELAFRFRELLNPLVSTVTGIDALDVSLMSVSESLESVNKSLTATGRAVKVVSGFLKIMYAGVLSIKTALEATGKAMAAYGAARALFLRGEFRAAANAIKIAFEDVKAGAVRTKDSIKMMWDDALQPVELATGRVGTFRRALEDVREAGRGAGRTLRGAVEPAIVDVGKKAKVAKKKVKDLKAIERSRLDAYYDTLAIEASLTKTRLDDLEVAYARELEGVRRLEEDKILVGEDAYRRRLALEQKYQQDMKEEMEREAESARYIGLSIADAIAQGLKEGFTSDNFKDVFKSILSLFSRIATLVPIPGVQLAGGIGNIFAGLFADGGLIQGPGTGTSDSILARVSDGEFVTRADSVRKFGSRFFERLNEGVLDISAIDRFATGGMVGSAPALASGPAVRGMATNVYVQAMDPSSALESVQRVVGPATYRYGMTYGDSKQIAQTRRRISPRSGRL